VARSAGTTRDDKIQNLIINQTLVYMGMFEEAFADLADKMTGALGAGISAAAGALAGPDAASQAAKGPGGVPPEVRTEIAQVLAEMREEVASQWPKNPDVFKKYISDPKFDRGIEIVESYDLGRPRLTEKLTDEALASYIFLLKGGDERAAKMFKELSDWQAGVPRPPWAH